MKRINILFLFALISISSFSQINTIKDRINKIIQNKNAGIGVAILDLNSNESVVINGEEHYPMQSVFKFPIALKVLSDVDKDKIKLGDSVFISSAELKKRLGVLYKRNIQMEILKWHFPISYIIW